ncbi:hypothetical protein DMTZ50_0095 [Dehalococcoides mccartyi]|uniref:Uncharacterized protein n=1 Tax=Dehalococcoides mccartyi TaxID=61435 RepID=A0A142VBU2_9CHLR|nr:hypothetical protein Dm11a5_1480 [Dehalococcoides mccartyi]MBA2084294.1 hypothetical protein [Dehalococcoides mccartyi]
MASSEELNRFLPVPPNAGRKQYDGFKAALSPQSYNPIRYFTHVWFLACLIF